MSKIVPQWIQSFFSETFCNRFSTRENKTLQFDSRDFMCSQSNVTGFLHKLSKHPGPICIHYSSHRLGYVLQPPSLSFLFFLRSHLRRLEILSQSGVQHKFRKTQVQVSRPFHCQSKPQCWFVRGLGNKPVRLGFTQCLIFTNLVHLRQTKCTLIIA